MSASAFCPLGVRDVRRTRVLDRADCDADLVPDLWANVLLMLEFSAVADIWKGALKRREPLGNDLR